MELVGCQDLAVPVDVMHHVVRVESSYNPYAIGVVGGKLARQPRNESEALATVRMLERQGYNFSLGLAQVNRYSLKKYGLDSYQKAFQACPNLQAGSKILAECYGRSGNDWGKSFSCYYSGNFVTGFRHGYVQKVYASMRSSPPNADEARDEAAPIAVMVTPTRSTTGIRRSVDRGVSRAFGESVAAPHAPRSSVAPAIESLPPRIDQAAPLSALRVQALASPPPVELPPAPDAALTPADEAFVF